MDMVEEDLKRKVAQFSQLQNLSAAFHHDPTDAGEPQEHRRRVRHRRFFSKHARHDDNSITEDKQIILIDDNTGEESTTNPGPSAAVTTPIGTAAAKTIAATQSSSLRARQKAPIFLPDDDVEFIRETPIISAQKSRERSTTSKTASLRNLSRTSRQSSESPSMPGGIRKKRKEESLQMRHEKDRIFKDLKFYFVPDNDIAPARRMRINKAREYGAAWVRQVNEATHMIVDKRIAYKDVENLIGQRQDLVVVNEEYPVECIQFRTLLTPSQKKYLVPGQPTNTEQTTPKKAVELEPVKEKVKPLNLVPILPLKPPQQDTRRWDFAPRVDSTPPKSGQSQSQSLADSSDAVPESQVVVLDLTPSKSMRMGSVDLLSFEIITTPKATSSKDELSSFINIMAEYKDLPLDIDDDEDGQSVTMSTMLEESEDEALGPSPEKGKQARKPVTRKEFRVEDRFACHHAGLKSQDTSNPNSRTIEILQKMLDYYIRINDQWRIMAYRKAIATLKRQDVRITTEEEAVALAGIGPSLAAKIEEIATTDKLQRLDQTTDDPSDSLLQLFLGVYGVGTRTAQQWIGKGWRTLEDLLAHAKLNQNQLIGIEYYKDLNTRIPREEMTQLGKIVTKAAKRIDSEVEVIIGGSYRRGAKDSGDVDFIITKKGTAKSTELQSFLNRLVRKLEADGFLTAKLASGGFHRNSDGSLWHGCCVLPSSLGGVGTWRRIDFLLVPESEIGGALIYFTGDDIFNRSLRLLARKKGMRLNQRGLFVRGTEGERANEGDLVEGRSERKIFEVLGVKWRPPEERWC
ncbi:hypothetical protein VHEMI03910 [[Torrubiella] hemipterigena]|uniref:DNA polymerase lambda n=1 Tax=[Torrubiella] hemipterigena TaxID=1531966 RepID=A0A0A1TC99_9HYPO|nr:hypothetical protein VHEMI03910 [[Torrubiella] hemipterigena]